MDRNWLVDRDWLVDQRESALMYVVQHRLDVSTQLTRRVALLGLIEFKALCNNY